MMQKAKFIQIIRQYPVLYDMSHEDYKNSFKKDKIWEEIGMDFNESGEDLKKKWKSLRDTYAKYIKRISTEGKARKWIWAEQMKFFRPYLSFTNKSLQGNSHGSDSEDQASESNMPVVVEENEYIISENDYMGQDSQPIESVLFLQESPASPIMPEVSIKAESSFNITRARSLKRKCDSGQATSLQEHFKHKRLKAVFDDMECLLLAHAKTIKKFSPKRQAITKYKIAQVILEQELLHVQEFPSRNAEAKRERHQSESSENSYADNP